MVDILRMTAGGGDSEVRELLRNRDWSTSPLGHPDTWPPELATAVSMVLSSAFPMFVAWGAELGFVYNDAYASLLGDKHPAAFGDRFQRIWHEIWADIVPIIDRALSNKPAYYEDLPLVVERHGYRERAYFTFSYSPLHDSEGSARGIYCTVVETTGRLVAERRAAFELRVADALLPLESGDAVIRTATALLAAELDMARVLVGDVDDARNVFTVGLGWQREDLPSLAGYAFPIDAFGPDIGELGRAGEVIAIADVDTDPRTTTVHGAYAALGVTAVLIVPLVRDGRLQGFLALGADRAYRWRDDDIALARSLAERIRSAVDLARTQDALRDARDRGRLILDSIAEGVILMASDWTILQISETALRLSNRTGEQIVGRGHWDVWPEALDTEGGRMLHRVMRTRDAETAEFQHLGEGGSGAWFEVRAYPTRGGGLVSVFRDISARKRAEEKLREADRRKDEFLAMLAHELRNPLAPIRAAADLLKIGRLDEARVRQSSAIIGRQVRHMTSLIDDLLDVSRVTRGLVTLVRAPVMARVIVDDAVEQVRPMFEARRQHLDVVVRDPDAVVMGDRARLVQVLANLLNNAAKYSPDERAIEVGAAFDDGQLVLAVRDEGVGMAPELTGHVFDLFTQAQRSSDRSQGGLGLGLALVKHLVELHGGGVSCSSPGLGQGSRFVVTLPAVAPAAHGAGMGADKKDALIEGGARRRLRLLVVDDNVDAAATLGMLLEACGHEVAVEHASLRALARVREFQPDAALLDIGLPEMDGNELARRLRADPASSATALIAVTGYGRDQDRGAALAAGFDHHLVKPVDMDRLAAVLAGLGA